MKEYTTRAKIESYLGASLTEAQVAMLPSLINASSIFIDNYTNNEFGAVSADRWFNGNGCNKILITAFSDITKIEVYNLDGEVDYEIPITDVYFNPQDKGYFYELLMKPNVSHLIFKKGTLNLKITGVFGVSYDGASVPDDVSLACTMLVVGILQGTNSKPANGVVKSETLGDYSISYDNTHFASTAENNITVSSILNSYKIYTV